MLKARGAIAQVQINTKRAFDLYTLATQTQGASWLTVEQLLFREAFDATKVNYDPLHSPLQSWGHKVTAALTACRQDAALGKDGSLLGPVAPSVARVLNRGRVMPAQPLAGSSSPRTNPRFKNTIGSARPAAGWDRDLASPLPRQAAGPSDCEGPPGCQQQGRREGAGRRRGGASGIHGYYAVAGFGGGSATHHLRCEALPGPCRPLSLRGRGKPDNPPPLFPPGPPCPTSGCIAQAVPSPGCRRGT